MHFTSPPFAILLAYLFGFVAAQAQRHFPGLAKSVGKGEEWLRKGHEYARASSRAKNCTKLIEELDALFAQQPFDHWVKQFDKNDVWWQPVQTSAEVREWHGWFAASCSTSATAHPAATQHVLCRWWRTSKSSQPEASLVLPPA